MSDEFGIWKQEPLPVDELEQQREKWAAMYRAAIGHAIAEMYRDAARLFQEPRTEPLVIPTLDRTRQRRFGGVILDGN